MDDGLKLFSEMIVDLQGFNDAHFGIFHQDEQEALMSMWVHDAHRNPNKFISMLSPAQKKLVAAWATQRTSYSTVRLIETLEKFIKLLKTLVSPTYPPGSSGFERKKGIRVKNSDAGLKGWKKIIYTTKKIPAEA